MRFVPLLFVPLLTIALIGCSTAAELSLLSQFFAASRLRDTTALKNIATVVFEPGTEGIITSFEITTVVSNPSDGGGSKEVSISAPVRLPTGQTARKDLVITMRRGDGHWMVTAITDAAPLRASPSTPRS